MAKAVKENKVLSKTEFKELYDYVSAIQKNLLEHNPKLNHLDDFDREIIIEDSMSKNAHCLGYGRIGINKGLFLKVKSKGELAGMIGHEIAHNSERHQLKKQYFKIISILIPWACTHAYFINATLYSPKTIHILPFVIVYKIGFDTFNNCYGRYLEREADLKSCELLDNANYDPSHFADYFRKRVLLHNSMYFFIKTIVCSTHPFPYKRVKYISEYIQENSLNLKKNKEEELEEIKSMYSFIKFQDECQAKLEKSTKSKQGKKPFVIETEL